MKCDSLACLWPDVPPIRGKITASAVLKEPSTLFTGGSDGSIISWRLSNNQSNPEIWPTALLCGHEAAVTGLEICTLFPIHRERDKVIDISSTEAGIGTALISVCLDGVLCVWSSGTGECKQRKKMPSWVGTPAAISALPTHPHYVCIACNYIDNSSSLAAADSASLDTGVLDVQNEKVIADTTVHKRTSKCVVLIVDSCNLTIIGNVLSGSMCIGPIIFMAAVPSMVDVEKQSVVMVDAVGTIQSAVVLVMSDKQNVEVVGVGQNNWGNGETHSDAYSLHAAEVEAVSVSVNGKLLAVILRNLCIFKLLSTGTCIGQISITETLFYDLSSQPSYFVGGSFLHCAHGDQVCDGKDSSMDFIGHFALWSDKGAAVIFTILGSEGTLILKPWCTVPAVSLPSNVNMSVRFSQAGNSIIRLESLSFGAESLLFWKPRVSLWSLVEPSIMQVDTIWKSDKRCSPDESINCPYPFSCTLLSEGGLLGDWTVKSHSLSIPKSCEIPQKSYAPNISSSSGGIGGNHRDSFLPEQQIISSSLILSEYLCSPYAVAYGFYNGDIEVVCCGTCFDKLNSHDSGSLRRHTVHQSISERYYFGHTGPVLCLAAHRIVAASSTERNYDWVLISGSSDSSVRVWNLDTGNLVSVMHHHVGPVRQIILAPAWTDYPWANCFLSVGEDACVALVSLETLRVERMFPGNPSYPETVLWDSARGYIACLCRHISSSSLVPLDLGTDVLYIWDVKTGGRERCLRGSASLSMIDHFCRVANRNSATEATSVATLPLPEKMGDAVLPQYHDSAKIEEIPLTTRVKTTPMKVTRLSESVSLGCHSSNENLSTMTTTFDSNSNAVNNTSAKNVSHQEVLHKNKKNLAKCSCPFPGVATLTFNLLSLMHPFKRDEETFSLSVNKWEKIHMLSQSLERSNIQDVNLNDSSEFGKELLSQPSEESAWFWSPEGWAFRFSLNFLHLWDLDLELDELLKVEMNICRPESFFVTSGLRGHRGAQTVAFPGSRATLELWRLSPEFCALRSLTMVSLALRMTSLSNSSSAASSALAAFYTRKFAEMVPDIKPPSLQLLVSFWQDPSEHVRMAARSLFHCAALRAIPLTLCNASKTVQHESHELSSTHNLVAECDYFGEVAAGNLEKARENCSQVEDESDILAWLESSGTQDCISCIGGSNQDAMASNIIVAGALAVWYPSLTKPSLARLVVHPLMKLVMMMNDMYSASAAELLAEGMENTWKNCIGPEIPQLIRDIFFQVECVSGTSIGSLTENPSVSTMKETLVEILLPSLAMADIPGFLNAIEGQVWATASDSPVHKVSLMTLIRIARGCPKPLALHLEKVVNFILLTMDQANSVLRKTCFNSSMTTLKEIVRIFPMIALNETFTRLAVGDAVGDIQSATIRVYDMQSLVKVKILDASGPLGIPTLLGGNPEMMLTTAVSALSFSPDGEGLVAFSEHGLVIRWWSLGTAWWEKLSRSYVPVQCTKLIFVPPWEGFSPNSSRSSIMASIVRRDSCDDTENIVKASGDPDSLKLLINNLDLSYRLHWIDRKKVQLIRHGSY
ncbi:hypothetical protein H6P81_011628 [Aristolochia fimbriata]|uniref:Uncharacterized protein n=1 Tax=Aristolochia fimbriata TaxID=158543 RepID=A0AAV7E9F6_ARIFI|nr:hypothetical protein H6P81_011628 [Aristolochia fimbriata]